MTNHLTDQALRRHRTFIWILLPCLAVSLFSVAYPIYVIRPFRHQGARELALALVVSQFRPAITAIAAFGAVLALIGFWRSQPRKWRRNWAAAGAVLAVVLAILARVNVYELMFHPIVRPAFLAARDVKLDGAEKVIAVRIGGEARAYPIRDLSYHHMVNDVLAGTAIVATY
jgi:Protein of unknown function (DUF3179)